LPLNKELQESLEKIGIKTGDEEKPIILRLLGVILKTCGSPPKSLSLTEIYEAMKKETPKKEFTKAWVRRVLNQLVDMKLVQIEDETAYRKHYVSDVNIVMGGLEELKSRMTDATRDEISVLQENLESINEIQCAFLAQELVKGLTGKSELITSRIIKTLEEFQRVLKYNIQDVSKKGDIIRATMGWIKPFLKGDRVKRTQRFFDAAMRGVEVRYLIISDIIQIESADDLDVESTMGMLEAVHNLQEKGMKFDARLYQGPPNYTFIALNEECMLLVVSETPLRATFTTRRFNPDLIDNAIESFEQQWDDSVSLLELSLGDMVSMGGRKDGMIPKALKEAKLDTTDDEK
jgi:hypothetical protein